jgi:hypothetical protein
MNSRLLHVGFCACLALLFVQPLLAFDWPGGTMTVTATCTGSEVFAGWVPSSPWGSTAFIADPQLHLRDASGTIVGQQVLTGGTMDWYESATRTAVVTFTVPAGTYSLVGINGMRHIRISGEGWSGFRLTFTTIVEPAAANGAPAIVWTSAPGPLASGQSYSVAARATDADGNLTQINVWKDGALVAAGGSGTGYESTAGDSSADGGPRSITFTAQAVDAAGETSAVISHVVDIAAPPPPPVQYSLSTSAGAGGTVSSGGIHDAGTIATVVATPDSYHDFAGWSGDARGTATPAGILMDRDKAVQANFAWKQFALTTSATGGGSVTPGGSYPYGSVVTLSAVPDPVSRFTGWTGGASGTAETVAVTINGPLTVQAVFVPKTAQTITFNNPGDRPSGAPPFGLDAATSSGLPVVITVLSGPAIYLGGLLHINGTGPVTVQASQVGDAVFLPAPPVTQTFNSVAPVVIKFSGSGRTVLQSRATETPVNLVLENP